MNHQTVVNNSLEKKSEEEGSIPFYPDHVRSEVRVVIWIVILVILIGLLGILMPVGLDEPADPLNTPAHVKPEWYFLSFYQVLKFIPKTTGGLMMVGICLVLLLWPFFENKPDRSKRAYRIRMIAAVIGLLVLTALTIWGEVS